MDVPTGGIPTSVSIIIYLVIILAIGIPLSRWMMSRKKKIENPIPLQESKQRNTAKKIIMSPVQWRTLYRIVAGLYLLVCFASIIAFHALGLAPPALMFIIIGGLVAAKSVKVIFWLHHNCPSCGNRLEGRFLGPTSYLFVNISECVHCSANLNTWSCTK